MTEGVQIARLGADTVETWDEYVLAAEDGTFFHLAGWKRVLEEAFGHRTHFLMAQREGRVCGVLPLAEVRSLLFGHALISTPFCVYGGVVADDEPIRAALTEAACALAGNLRVDYLELRNRREQNPDWPSKSLYVTFRKPIHATSDENMSAIPRKQRAMVRKGIKAGLEAGVEPGVDTLYECYAESVRNLGTPVFAASYLAKLREVFGGACEVCTVRKDGEAVASVMSFYFRDEVLPYYGGGKVVARRLQANDYMYWAVMEQAVERGTGLFDYGRSKIDTGSYRFKKHWGFEPEPLHYEYHLVKARSMPDLSPANPKYRLFINVWQRLPLWLAGLIGPRLARHLG